jgi:CheY-like chemotaxis protein
VELSQKLRTPLNAIIGFAELVARRPGTAAKDPDVQLILKAARDLLEIINRELADPDVQPKNAPNLVPPISCDVLYIEDDLVNFTLVERILEFRPALKLLHAARGETGIELAQIHLPKLILLDLNLPDMHGSEVLAKLQSNRTTAQLPVVVLSADATSSQIERLLTAGARNYLTKPFDIDPFLAVVDEMVSDRAPASHS